MIILGLTGSIGMGKSTTAALFAEAGLTIYDADQVVRTLYRGKAVVRVSAAFPGVVKNGEIDRKRLSVALDGRAENYKTLEKIIHPLVFAERQSFIEKAQIDGAEIVVLDIPLLFETGSDAEVDYIVVVTCSPEIQRRRVLERPDMTVEKFEILLKRQLSDSEKRKRADYIVDTGHGLNASRIAVGKIIADLKIRGR